MTRSNEPNILLPSNTDLGRLVAEEDPRLSEYYIDRTRYVDRALRVEDPTLLFAGPKGVGKSAILQMIRLEKQADEKRVINISPDDLAFSALANVKASSPILSDAGRNQWLFTSLWDYILSIEILRREYPNQVLFGRVLTRFFGSEHDKHAIRLLKLSIDDSGNPRTLTERILELVDEVQFAANVDGAGAEGRVKLKAPGERSGDQLRLLSQVNHVAKNLPGELHHPYHILIDDLDLHWNDTEIQNAFIAALVLSLRKLSRPPNLKFVVALRDDILRKLPIEDKDKIRDRVCTVRWDKQTVRQMVEARVGILIGCPKYDVWTRLFPNDTFDRMWAHSKGLPRELIRLAIMALEEGKAQGNKVPTSEDVSNALVNFSKQRIEEIDNENRHSLPGLAPLIRRFRGWPKEFPYRRIEDLVVEVAADIEGKTSPATQYSWAAGYLDDPLGFAKRLLECGFLQYKPSRTARAVDYYAEPDVDLRVDAWFAVHPVYGPGLGLIGEA